MSGGIASLLVRHSARSMFAMPGRVFGGASLFNCLEAGAVNDLAQFGDGHFLIVVLNHRFAFLVADLRFFDAFCFLQCLLDRAGTAASSHSRHANNNGLCRCRSCNGAE